mgnify:CR=1 FL=1
MREHLTCGIAFHVNESLLLYNRSSYKDQILYFCEKRNFIEYPIYRNNSRDYNNVNGD